MSFRQLCLTLILAIGFERVRAIPVNNSLVFKPPEVVVRTETVCGTVSTADFILVIDGSTSIGADNFDRIRNWLADSAALLPETTRYAVIEFSGNPVTLWNLAAYTDRDAVVDAFRTMRYITGTTKLALALEYLIEEGFLEQNNGNRQNVPDNVVVITDGRSSDDPHDVAERLRNEFGVNMYAIGITRAIDAEQLNSIVTGEKNPEGGDAFLAVEDFSLLDESVTRQLLESRTTCETREITDTIGDGTIDLQCNPDSIYVGSDTLNPFEGKVFVKGNVNDDECKVFGDGQSNKAEMTLPIDKCGTIKRRSLDPPGIFIENEVVFSFHQKFVTKVDRVYKVKCFFMEASKTVDTEIEVGKLTTQLAEEQFPMPTCMYSLHRDAPDGPLVRFAVVGEKIFHRWECDDSTSGDLFRLRVHSCYVEGGSNGRQELLDADGCAIDQFLLGNLNYEEGKLLAYVESHAFKFPDNPDERFQCEIELCVTLEDGCQSTPPTCDAPIRRRRELGRSPAANHTAAPRPARRRNLDVSTENIMVAQASDLDFDVEDLHRLRAEQNSQSETSSTESGICIGPVLLFVIVAFALVIVLGTLVVLMMLNNRCTNSR